MASKHLFSTVVLVLLIGVLTIAIIASGFDIGDTDPDCAENEIAKVINGVWNCTIDDTGSAFDLNLVQNYSGMSCPNGTYVSSRYQNGTFHCRTDLSGGEGSSEIVPSLSVDIANHSNTLFINYSTLLANLSSRFTNDTDTDTQLTTEEVQDIIGASLDDSTLPGVIANYNDTLGSFEFGFDCSEIAGADGWLVCNGETLELNFNDTFEHVASGGSSLWVDNDLYTSLNDTVSQQLRLTDELYIDNFRVFQDTGGDVIFVLGS